MSTPGLRDFTDPARFEISAADIELFEQKLGGFIPPNAFDAHAHWYDLRHLDVDAAAPEVGQAAMHESMRQWMGDSRGHWEGDTLVVDTTNFLRETSFRGGVTTSDLHLRERFTRVSDGTLMYEVTTEDPNTWNRPWTYRIPMVKSEYPLYEYACHEGNYGLYNILAGAREQEAAAEAAASR